MISSKVLASPTSHVTLHYKKQTNCAYYLFLWKVYASLGYPSYIGIWAILLAEDSASIDFLIYGFENTSTASAHGGKIRRIYCWQFSPFLDFPLPLILFPLHLCHRRTLHCDLMILKVVECVVEVILLLKFLSCFHLFLFALHPLLFLSACFRLV